MVLLSAAYNQTAVATLAPFEYFAIFYGILFGFLIWQEVPSLMLLGGVVLIVGSGLFIIYREKLAVYDYDKNKESTQSLLQEYTFDVRINHCATYAQNALS